MTSDPLYDTIGSTYTATRRADPRIARHVHAAVGDATTVLNVGAGTGNYEPIDRCVVALEPSNAMIAARPPGAAPPVRGAAEAMPFPDRAFDAVLALLTVHHWNDLAKGLGELRRVSDRQIIFTFDPNVTDRFWALDYWPEARNLPSEANAPTPRRIAELLRTDQILPVPVPADCTDGFGAAYWRRPEAYLDPIVQQGMSWLAQLPAETLARGARQLDADLRSGAWERQHGWLRSLHEHDLGYRIVLAGVST